MFVYFLQSRKVRSVRNQGVGELCPKGNWTLIKAAKPNQDMRFDVPCVGPDTIESLAANGGRCLVVQKDSVVIIDKPETIELANRLGIAIVGY